MSTSHPPVTYGLRGACLIQGVVAAQQLRARWPALRITETHPKALLWLLGIATQDRPHASLSCADLDAIHWAASAPTSEHERDAALGAFAAMHMLLATAEWHDLHRCEPDAIEPVEQVEYWLPHVAAAPNAIRAESSRA